MKSALGFVLIGIAALLVGLLIGPIAFPVQTSEKIIEKQICQPAICEVKLCEKPVKCEVCKACIEVYAGKFESKKEAELVLNKTLYKLKSSRDCKDFLDNFESRTKVIEDFKDVKDGCEILYSFR